MKNTMQKKKKNVVNEGYTFDLQIHQSITTSFKRKNKHFIVQNDLDKFETVKRSQIYWVRLLF